ncbi:DNA polymerase [Bartonella grahamii]|uniref:DNA polymerase n=1 Tax=Bartonella grahamii TaxID=33045 RepID=UPI001ABA2B1C|nr:DNA polymerase [Bartonella grahamii]
MRLINFRKLYTFTFKATIKEPVKPYMVSIVNVEDLTDITVFTINDGDPVRLFLEFVKKIENSTRFYAYNLNYDYAIIRSWCHFNQNDLITPKFYDFISQNNRVLRSELAFQSNKSKRVYLFDSLELFLVPLQDIITAFTDLKQSESSLFECIDDVIIHQNDIDCCVNESKGLAIALKKRLQWGRNKMTFAADAKAVWSEKMFKKFTKIKAETYLFPSLEEGDDYIFRKANDGGFCFFNRYMGKFINKEIEIYDVNSMGPAMMLKQLPIGAPLYKKGKIETNDLHPLGLQRFYINSAELRENKIPILNNNTQSSSGGVEYLQILSEYECEHKKIFMLTLQEFELFKQSYHYQNLELLDGYLFQARDDLFTDYIDEFFELKNSSDKTISRIGKMFLNSLCGKMAERPHRIKRYIEFENDVLRFIWGETIFQKCGYLPISLFAGSYARMFLIESIYKIGLENFIYCDTDSIHCFKTENAKKLDIHPSKIGAWKLENKKKIIAAKYLARRRYCLQFEDNTFQAVCPYIPSDKLTPHIKSLDDFQLGKSVKMKGFEMGVGGLYPIERFVPI